MSITSIMVLFGGGIVVGLFLPLLSKLLNFRFITDLSLPLRSWLANLFSGIGRLFRKRGQSREVIPDRKGVAAPRMDPREQQLNDSAQVIRAILLNLAGLIQRTDQAAQTSSTTLGGVRTTIEDMRLPPDLSEVHDRLLTEIDRMISSNTTLKTELARSKDNLEAQRRQIENLKTATRIDGLTQLANRAYFDEKLAELILLQKRYQDPFSLMMIDVDNFKPINDTHGHQAGDRILKGVAFKLKSTIRESDFLARYGGDEFALVLIKVLGQEAVELGWKLCRVLEESRFLLDGKDFTVTISVGAAEALAGDTPETLTRRADQALYQAKQEGRNRASLARSPKTAGSPGKSKPH